MYRPRPWVYAAYDPELDRKIALKLLLTDAHAREVPVRLLRDVANTRDRSLARGGARTPIGEARTGSSLTPVARPCLR